MLVDFYRFDAYRRSSYAARMGWEIFCFCYQMIAIQYLYNEFQSKESVIARVRYRVQTIGMRSYVSTICLKMLETYLCFPVAHIFTGAKTWNCWLRQINYSISTMNVCLIDWVAVQLIDHSRDWLTNRLCYESLTVFYLIEQSIGWSNRSWFEGLKAYQSFN